MSRTRSQRAELDASQRAEPDALQRAAREGAVDRLQRFDGVERTVHWLNAMLFLLLVVTGAALYFTPLISLLGRRALVLQIHLYAGLMLPVPLLIAISSSWGRQLRRDIGAINRWSEADRAWLRQALRAERWHPSTELGDAGTAYVSRAGIGKFNAGQKLNAAFTAGGGLVMLATGSLLRWYQPFPLSWRAGATFVHNWLALLFFLAICGHIALALSDREALRSMLFGRISRRWAEAHAPAWLDEQVRSATQARDG